MAKQGKAGLGTYIFGAFVLFAIFGSDDKDEQRNVTSYVTAPSPQKQTPTPIPTQPQITTKVTKKPASVPSTTTVSLPKIETQKQARKMYVDASRLNVRNQAGKHGKVIWTLKRDQEVQVTNKDGEWLFVEGSRFKGWVFATYLTNNPAPKQASIPKKAKKKQSAGLSTSRIKKILIKRSHAYYSGNCPCPYNRTSRGHKCGKRSAYSRPGGASPLCYASDVTAQMVAEYRARQ
jgi:hypothetical protein